MSLRGGRRACCTTSWSIPAIAGSGVGGMLLDATLAALKARGAPRVRAQRTAAAAARPAVGPENRQPPRNVPSSAR